MFITLLFLSFFIGIISIVMVAYSLLRRTGQTKKWLKILGISFVVFLISGMLAPPPETNIPDIPKQTESVAQNEQTVIEKEEKSTSIQEPEVNKDKNTTTNETKPTDKQEKKEEQEPKESNAENTSDTESKSPKEIAVHFIDVGQADSIFIDAGEYDILIDAGNNDDGDLVVNYLKSLKTDDLELVVATHPHEDHIGGLDTVLAAFDVETIIDSGKSYTTKTYTECMAAIKAEKSKYLQDDDMTFKISKDISFNIIECGDNYEDLNDVSVVSLLDYKDIEILFTGDMEADVEKRNLDKFPDVEILKVGHHGSHSSSSAAFLDKVKPEAAIISCGANNRYNHPHQETLSALAERNIKIYRTDKVGHIVVTTNGEEFSINKSEFTYIPSAVAPDVPKKKDEPSNTTSSAKYVGSKRSDKYHYPSCRWAKKIKPENLIEFSSVQEAKSKGYKPCGTCKPPNK